jgi:hypothetical protein
VTRPMMRKRPAKQASPRLGFLSGGFLGTDLRKSGCITVYPGPAALLVCFDGSPLEADRSALVEGGPDSFGS